MEYTKADWKAIKDAMVIYGSDFERALKRLLDIADSENTERIIATWPETWKKYYDYFI